MTGRSPIQERLIDIVRREPEWGQSALLGFFERIKAGDQSEASAKKWRDERAAAGAAHLAKTA